MNNDRRRSHLSVRFVVVININLIVKKVKGWSRSQQITPQCSNGTKHWMPLRWSPRWSRTCDANQPTVITDSPWVSNAPPEFISLRPINGIATTTIAKNNILMSSYPPDKNRLILTHHEYMTYSQIKMRPKHPTTQLVVLAKTINQSRIDYTMTHLRKMSHNSRLIRTRKSRP